MRKYFFICSLLLLSTTIANAKILFASVRNGEGGIYIMDDDGSNKTLLTDTNSPTYPRWSPNGKQIVFVRSANPDDWEHSYLFLMNKDGTNIRQITGPHNGSDDYPSFSPNGKSILFLRYERFENGTNKFSMNILNLVNREIHEIRELPGGYPEWSPDGKKIAFFNRTLVDEHDTNIFIMDADGNNLQELLLQPPANDLIISRAYPRWSSDGQRILFVQRETGGADNQPKLIRVWKAHRYMISDSKGNLLRQLDIPINRFCGSIDWMNNGKSIVFSGCEIELNKPLLPDRVIPPYNIYKYHIDSGELIRITEHKGNDYLVDWISDDVYTVTPKGKQTVRWGEIKTFLPEYHD